jgi:DNA-directed RNA polymerase III subunit RPC8
MFVLTVMQDEIRIHPSRFNAAVLDSLVAEIDAKYSNKVSSAPTRAFPCGADPSAQVFPDVGLCISIWDILEVGESIIYPGDGHGHVVVKFRMIVFRPADGEVLLGKIVSQDERGIR